MNVIITGASGFVGQNLSAYLSTKECLIEHLSLRSENWQLKISNNAQAIVHLAGKAHDLENSAEEDEYFEVNRDLTIQLFKEFLNSNIRDFFYFSSVKAVADVSEAVVDEELSPNPKTSYGRSKRAAEEYLLEQKLPAGKRLFVIRPCMIHGPGNKGNLNLLFKIVEKGIPWPLVKFENRRSFLSIDNLSYLVFEILQNNFITSGIYHFADDDPLSTNELIVCLNNALGRRAKFLPIPKSVIQSIAKVGDKINFPLNSERLKKLTENYVVSNQKIKKALDITRLPLSAEEGICKTIKSFKTDKL